MSSPHDSGEEDTSQSDEALEEVNSHIKEAFEIMKRETKKVRMEREALDEAAKKLEHVHFSTMLKLNVGGHLFSTSLSTLNKDPGSMLHAMFSERFDTKASEDGSYFIDRDGTHFRYILNYLRTGQLVVPEDKVVRRELLTEAEFYQVEGIIKELKARPFKDSVILSSDQRQTLIKWLKETLTSASYNYGLLYRASRDGWTASNFQSCCDFKGPTVIVVKCGENIFGGYTEESWESGSMLHAMFSGRFDTKPAEDGSYFIDRDGTHFRYILNYLRTGQLIVPKDEIIREELLAEAEFFQVEGMIKSLKISCFKDSVILSSDQRKTLVTWLKESQRTITNDSDKLLYRASRNGWGASNFHSCCDNKGPTVTVVKSGKYIFGGYTDQNWDGSGYWKRAPGSFLFSLVNPSGLPPTKMPLIAGMEEYAIYCDSGYGPTFGNGHDLCIPDAPNSNNGTVSLNNSYQCPTGQNANAVLTGNQNFRVNEIEVFGFDN